MITSILRNVVQKGTGYRARINGMQVAGKTGTSNQSRDVWFCGYTPDLQAIVWYGRDDNQWYFRFHKIYFIVKLNKLLDIDMKFVYFID